MNNEKREDDVDNHKLNNLHICSFFEFIKCFHIPPLMSPSILVRHEQSDYHYSVPTNEETYRKT